MREQGSSEHVVFNGIDNTDATRAAVLLTSNLQRPFGTAEGFLEHRLCPLLYTVTDFVYALAVPTAVE